MLPEIQERTRKKHERTCSTCLAAGGGQSPPSWWLVFVMFCTCSFMFCLYFGQIHALVFGEQFSTRGMFLMFLLIFYQCTWRVQVQNKQDTSYIIVWVILQVIMHYIPDIQNKPSSWTVVAFLPSSDKDVSHQWDAKGGNRVFFLYLPCSILVLCLYKLCTSLVFGLFFSFKYNDCYYHHTINSMLACSIHAARSDKDINTLNNHTSISRHDSMA